ncbi:MAG: outer membrane protein assembly factor BamA [Spirochaetes bacterium]|nr:outer membrane protein assembly factor BamA [Spirochaetota bacterium]
MCLRRVSALFILLGALAASFSFAADRVKDAENTAVYEGLTVTSVTVKGNIRQSTSFVTGLMVTGKGRKLELSVLDNDIKNLFSTGNFDNVSVEAQTSSGGVALTVNVEERPIIVKVEYSGYNKKTPEQFKELVETYSIKAGATYSRRRVDEAVDALVALYHDDGYLSATVRPDVSMDEKSGSVSITFFIEEGRDIRVRSIRFHGNKEINEGDLKGAMETKEDFFFISEGKFKQASFELDKEKIVKLYKTRGYYKARIRNVRIDYRWRNPQEKTAKDMIIDIDVYEGDRYLFGDITVEGNRLITLDTIVSDFKAKKGDTYNFEIATMDQQFLQMKYSERGYIFSRVRPVTDVDDSNRIVNIKYDIYEGDKAHIENIRIEGMTKTKENIIRRYLDVQEGEIFNALKIQASREKVFNTQFFKDVALDAKPGTTEGLMTLIFKIEEGQTGMVSGGGSWGTASGFGLNFEIREINFFGNGQTVNGKIEFGQFTRRVSGGFVEPYVLGLPFYFASEISYNDYQTQLDTLLDDGTNYAKYGTRSFDFYLRFGYYFWDYFLTSISGRYSIATYYQSTNMGANSIAPRYLPIDIANKLTERNLYKRYDGGTNYSETFTEWYSKYWYNTFILTFNLTRDSRNNTLNPTRGWMAGFNADIYFGETTLTKVTLNASYVQPLPLGSAFVVYGEYGALLDNPFSSSMSNEGSTLFFINYLEDVRGWSGDVYTAFKTQHGLQRYTTLSSSYDGTNTNSSTNYYSFGRSRLRLSAEYRYTFVPNVLSGVAFLDMGQTWYNPKGWHPEFNPAYAKASGWQNDIGFNPGYILDARNYIYSTGLGIRVLIPMLPIRFFLAKRFVFDGYRFKDFDGDKGGKAFLGDMVGNWMNWEPLGRGWQFVVSMSQQF